MIISLQFILYLQEDSMISEESFIELTIGMVCSMQYIKDFIKKLQIKQGEEMKIFQNSKELSISCSNQVKDICPFRYLFAKKIDVESKEIGLQLKKKHTQHSLLCKVNNEDDCFQRNRLLIINSKNLITNIILSRYKQYGPQNPKKILQIVSQAMGFSDLFINKGIRSPQLKRKIKKKFDNLVAQIRKEYNLTPTKIKKSRSIKKQKPRFTLFRQKSQSYQNQQQNKIEQFSEEQDSDDQSQFKPFTRNKIQNQENNQSMQNQTNEKEILKQEAMTPQDALNSDETKNHRILFEQKRKTKIIKKL